MKKIILSVLFLFVCINPVFAQSGYVEGEVLAELNVPAYEYSESMSYAAKSSAGPIKTLNTYSALSEISGGNIIHLKSETKSTEQLMRELADDPRVKSVQPNYIRYVNKIPDDAGYENLWNMGKIRMPEVWDNVTGNPGICVAVLDSGIDYNHEDLKDNMAADSYGNPGRSFLDNGRVTNDPMDNFGHGTHVAGTIGAAGNNGIGVTGINWNIKLLAVNVLPDGQGYDSDIIKGMEYILSEKNKGLDIRVVNISLGSWETFMSDNSPFGRALKSLSDAGIICAIAAGNEGQSISTPGGTYRGKRIYPACFRFANTITVGAVGSGGAKGPFSNYSGAWVHIAAPGGDDSSRIYSTLPASKGQYGHMNGTSMATAHVSGAAAVLFSAFPNETPAQIKNRILKGAKKEGVSEGYWENGTLDVMAAYEYTGGVNDDDSVGSDNGGNNNGSGGSGGKSGGGGGGCSAGYGYRLAFMGMLPLFVLKRKK